MAMYQALASVLPGTLLLNFKIPNTRYGTGAQTATDEPYHPHLCDLYEPRGLINFAFVLAHGGSGSKEEVAISWGIKIGTGPATVKAVRWSILANRKCAVLVPQGGHLDGTVTALNPTGINTERAQNQFQGVATWSNHCMNSGRDDVQFAKDAAVWLHDRYGSVFRIFGGHSNGGMMAHRCWTEHLSGMYNCYAATSGAASDYYLDNPTMPAIVKPMYQQFGALDTTLQVYPGRFFDATLTQADTHVSVADVTIPVKWIGPFERFKSQVAAYNTYKSLPAETVSATVDGVKVVQVDLSLTGGAGTQTTWTYCGGAMVLRLLSAASHKVKSMQAATKRTLFGDFMTFAAQNVGN